MREREGIRAGIGRCPAGSAATVTFPSINTGVYGYPITDAAAIALGEVAAYLSSNSSALAKL